MRGRHTQAEPQTLIGAFSLETSLRSLTWEQGVRAVPGGWAGEGARWQSGHGQGGQASRHADGIAGNKFPVAEPLSPGLGALHALSGAFWGVTLVSPALSEAEVSLGEAVGAEVRPPPGSWVSRWRCLCALAQPPFLPRALLAKPCRL